MFYFFLALGVNLLLDITQGVSLANFLFSVSFFFTPHFFFFRVLFHARIQVTKWSIATDGQLLSRLSIPMIFHGDSSSPAWQKKSLLQDFIFYFFIIFSYWWYREQRHKEQLLCQGQTKKLWWWYQSFRQTRKLFPAFIFFLNSNNVFKAYKI